MELYICHEFKNRSEEKQFCIISVLIHSRIQRPIDELKPGGQCTQSLTWFGPSIGHIDRRGKNQFIVGLPRCNMNSKIQILGKNKNLTEKSLTESHFRQTNISPDLLSVCEVRRSDKCSSISIFRCYLFEAPGPDWFIVLRKILLPSKENATNISWCQNGRKNRPNNADQVFAWWRRYMREGPTLESRTCLSLYVNFKIFNPIFVIFN